MIFDQVTDSEMQAARILGGVTMAGLLAAPLFRRQAHAIKMTVAGLYVIGALGFVVYFLI